MTLEEFNIYMNEQFDLLIKELCSESSENSEDEDENEN